MRIRQMLALAVMASLSTFVACGGGEGTTNPPPENSDPLLGDFPPGTFATDIDSSDVSFDFLVGHWALIFRETGGVEVTQNGARVVTGFVAVSDDEITFNDQSGTLACLPPAHQGTYRWSFDGGNLTLTPVSEPCDGRPQVLAVGPWTKQ